MSAEDTKHLANSLFPSPYPFPPRPFSLRDHKIGGLVTLLHSASAGPVPPRSHPVKQASQSVRASYVIPICHQHSRWMLLSSSSGGWVMHGVRDGVSSFVAIGESLPFLFFYTPLSIAAPIDILLSFGLVLPNPLGILACGYGSWPAFRCGPTNSTLSFFPAPSPALYSFPPPYLALQLSPCFLRLSFS